MARKFMVVDSLRESDRPQAFDGRRSVGTWPYAGEGRERRPRRGASSLKGLRPVPSRSEATTLGLQRRTREAFAVVFLEEDLADAHRGGRHLHQFVLLDVLERLLQVQAP